MAAGGVGGMAGGLAGGLTAYGLTGGELRGKDLAAMVWTGAASGLVGASGAAVRATRAGAYTGVPERVASSDGGLPPDAAPMAQISAPGDGQPPQAQTASPERVSTTSEVDAPRAGGPEPGFGDGSMDRPSGLTPEMMAEGEQIFRDLFDSAEGADRQALAAFMRGDDPGQLPDGSGGTTPGNAPDYPSGGPSHPYSPSSPGRGGSWPAWGSTEVARAGSSVAVAAPPEGGSATPMPTRQAQISDPQVRPDQSAQPVTPGLATEVLVDGSSSYPDPLLVEHGPTGDMYLVAPEQTTGNTPQEMTGPRPAGETLEKGATAAEEQILRDLDFDPALPQLDTATPEQPTAIEPPASATAPTHATPQLSPTADANTPLAPPSPPKQEVASPTASARPTADANNPVASANPPRPAPDATASPTRPGTDTNTPGLHRRPPEEPRTPFSHGTSDHTPSAAHPHPPNPIPFATPSALSGHTPGGHHDPAASASMPTTPAAIPGFLSTDPGETPQSAATPPAPIAATSPPGDDEPSADPEEFPTPPGTVVDDPREHNVQKDPREHSVWQDPRDHSVQKKPAGDYVTIPGVSYPLEDEPPANAIPVIPRTPALTPLPVDSVGLGRAFHNPDNPENTPGPTSPRAPDITNPLSDRHLAAPETGLNAGLAKPPPSLAMPSGYATEPNPEAPGAPQKPASPQLNPHSLEYSEDPSRLPAIGGLPPYQPAPQPKKTERKRLVTRMGGDPEDKRRRTRKQPPPPPPPEPPQPRVSARSDAEGAARGTSRLRGQQDGRNQSDQPAENIDVTSARARELRQQLQNTVMSDWPVGDHAEAAEAMAAALLRTAQGTVVVRATNGGEGHARWVSVEITDQSRETPARDEQAVPQTDSGRAIELVERLAGTWGFELRANGERTRYFTLFATTGQNDPSKVTPEPAAKLVLQRGQVQAGTSRARRMIGDLLERASADDRQIDDVQLVVSEVVGNVGLYAKQGGAEIRAWLIDDVLRVEVADTSRGLPKWRPESDVEQDDEGAPSTAVDRDAEEALLAAFTLDDLDAADSDPFALGERAAGTHGRGSGIIAEITTARGVDLARDGRPGKTVWMEIQLSRRPVQPSPDTFTEQEVEILRLIAEGNTNDAIAAALEMSWSGVRNQLTHIGEKLGTGKRAAMVAVALRTGLLPLTDPAAEQFRGNLSPREIDVLGRVAAGETTAHIGQAIGISPRVVENHLARIGDEFGVTDRAAMVAVALRAGILPLDPTAEAPANDDELSTREIDVLGMVAEGRSSLEISTSLNLSVATVRQVLTRIGEKLDAANRAAMVAIALRSGILPFVAPAPAKPLADRVETNPAPRTTSSDEQSRSSAPDSSAESRPSQETSRARSSAPDPRFVRYRQALTAAFSTSSGVPESDALRQSLAQVTESQLRRGLDPLNSTQRKLVADAVQAAHRGDDIGILQRAAVERLARSIHAASLTDGSATPAPTPGDTGSALARSGPRHGGVTDREIEVLELVAADKTNKEIGELLGTSPSTVKTQLAAIGGKLGTGDRAGMVAIALRTGILPLTSNASMTGGDRVLSSREVEVLGMAAAGRTNKEIAVALGMSPVTVKGNLTRIGKKLGANGRAGMVAIGLRSGVLPVAADESVPTAEHNNVLSEREAELLGLIADGKTYREIAGALDLSTATVDSHLRRIARKLGTTNHAAMVAIALRTGILPMTILPDAAGREVVEPDGNDDARSPSGGLEQPKREGRGGKTDGPSPGAVEYFHDVDPRAALDLPPDPKQNRRFGRRAGPDPRIFHHHEDDPLGRPYGPGVPHREDTAEHEPPAHRAAEEAAPPQGESLVRQSPAVVAPGPVGSDDGALVAPPTDDLATQLVTSVDTRLLASVRETIGAEQQAALVEVQTAGDPADVARLQKLDVMLVHLYELHAVLDRPTTIAPERLRLLVHHFHAAAEWAEALMAADKATDGQVNPDHAALQRTTAQRYREADERVEQLRAELRETPSGTSPAIGFSTLLSSVDSNTVRLVREGIAAEHAAAVVDPRVAVPDADAARQSKLRDMRNHLDELVDVMQRTDTTPAPERLKLLVHHFNAAKEWLAALMDVKNAANAGDRQTYPDRVDWTRLAAAAAARYRAADDRVGWAAAELEPDRPIVHVGSPSAAPRDTQLAPTETPLPPPHVEKNLGAVAGVSDIGLDADHPTNQDVFKAATVIVRDQPVHFLAVADGVSRSARGDEAADVGATVALDHMVAAATTQGGEFDPLRLVHNAMTAADAAVVALADKYPGAHRPPRATIVLAVVEPHRITTDSRGDSRGYWLALDDGESKKLTTDDTLLSRLVESGMSEVEALQIQYAHQIQRYLGSGPTEGSHAESVPISGKGVLLLCTDGLWNEVFQPEALTEIVRSELERSPGDLLAAAKALEQRALAAGGHDNITAVLASPAQTDIPRERLDMYVQLGQLQPGTPERERSAAETARLDALAHRWFTLELGMLGLEHQLTAPDLSPATVAELTRRRDDMRSEVERAARALAPGHTDPAALRGTPPRARSETLMQPDEARLAFQVVNDRYGRRVVTIPTDLRDGLAAHSRRDIAQAVGDHNLHRFSTWTEAFDLIERMPTKATALVRMHWNTNHDTVLVLTKDSGGPVIQVSPTVALLKPVERATGATQYDPFLRATWAALFDENGALIPPPESNPGRGVAPSTGPSAPGPTTSPPQPDPRSPQGRPAGATPQAPGASESPTPWSRWPATGPDQHSEVPGSPETAVDDTVDDTLVESGAEAVEIPLYGLDRNDRYVEFTFDQVLIKPVHTPDGRLKGVVLPSEKRDYNNVRAWLAGATARGGYREFGQAWPASNVKTRKPGVAPRWWQDTQTEPAGWYDPETQLEPFILVGHASGSGYTVAIKDPATQRFKRVKVDGIVFGRLAEASDAFQAAYREHPGSPLLQISCSAAAPHGSAHRLLARYLHRSGFQADVWAPRDWVYTGSNGLLSVRIEVADDGTLVPPFEVIRAPRDAEHATPTIPTADESESGADPAPDAPPSTGAGSGPTRPLLPHDFHLVPNPDDDILGDLRSPLAPGGLRPNRQAEELGKLYVDGGGFTRGRDREDDPDPTPSTEQAREHAVPDPQRKPTPAGDNEDGSENQPSTRQRPTDPAADEPVSEAAEPAVQSAAKPHPWRHRRTGERDVSTSPGRTTGSLPKAVELRIALRDILTTGFERESREQVLADATISQVMDVLDDITPQQLLVIQRLGSAHSIDQIAQELGLAATAVEDLGKEAASVILASLIVARGVHRRQEVLSKALSEASPWQLQDALRRLGREQQRIVVGLCRQGNSRAEMAAALGHDEDTIGLLAYGAVRRMADFIAGRESERTSEATDQDDARHRTTQRDRVAAVLARVAPHGAVLDDVVRRLNELLRPPTAIPVGASEGQGDHSPADTPPRTRTSPAEFGVTVPAHQQTDAASEPETPTADAAATTTVREAGIRMEYDAVPMPSHMYMYTPEIAETLDYTNVYTATGGGIHDEDAPYTTGPEGDVFFLTDNGDRSMPAPPGTHALLYSTFSNPNIRVYSFGHWFIDGGRKVYIIFGSKMLPKASADLKYVAQGLFEMAERGVPVEFDDNILGDLWRKKIPVGVPTAGPLIDQRGESPHPAVPDARTMFPGATAQFWMYVTAVVPADDSLSIVFSINPVLGKPGRITMVLTRENDVITAKYTDIALGEDADRVTAAIDEFHTRVVDPWLTRSGAIFTGSDAPVDSATDDPGAHLQELRIHLESTRAELAEVLGVLTDLVRGGWVRQAVTIAQRWIRGLDETAWAVVDSAQDMDLLIDWVALRLPVLRDIEAANAAQADPVTQQQIADRGEELDHQLANLLGLSEPGPTAHTSADNPLMELRALADATSDPNLQRLAEAIENFLLADLAVARLENEMRSGSEHRRGQAEATEAPDDPNAASTARISRAETPTDPKQKPAERLGVPRHARDDAAPEPAPSGPTVSGTMVVETVELLGGTAPYTTGGVVAGVDPESGPNSLVLHVIEARSASHDDLREQYEIPWVIDIETGGLTVRCNIAYRDIDGGPVRAYISHEEPQLGHPQFGKFQRMVYAALLKRFEGRVIELDENFDGRAPHENRILEPNDVLAGPERPADTDASPAQGRTGADPEANKILGAPSESTRGNPDEPALSDTGVVDSESSPQSPFHGLDDNGRHVEFELDDVWIIPVSSSDGKISGAGFPGDEQNADDIRAWGLTENRPGNREFIPVWPVSDVATRMPDIAPTSQWADHPQPEKAPYFDAETDSEPIVVFAHAEEDGYLIMLEDRQTGQRRGVLVDGIVFGRIVWSSDYFQTAFAHHPGSQLLLVGCSAAAGDAHRLLSNHLHEQGFTGDVWGGRDIMLTSDEGHVCIRIEVAPDGTMVPPFDVTRAPGSPHEEAPAESPPRQAAQPEARPPSHAPRKPRSKPAGTAAMIGGAPDLVNPFDERNPWDRGGPVPRHQRINRLAEPHADGGGFVRGIQPEPPDDSSRLGGTSPEISPTAPTGDRHQSDSTPPRAATSREVAITREEWELGREDITSLLPERWLSPQQRPVAVRLISALLDDAFRHSHGARVAVSVHPATLHCTVTAEGRALPTPDLPGLQDSWVPELDRSATSWGFALRREPAGTEVSFVLPYSHYVPSRTIGRWDVAHADASGERTSLDLTTGVRIGRDQRQLAAEVRHAIARLAKAGRSQTLFPELGFSALVDNVFRHTDSDAFVNATMSDQGVLRVEVTDNDHGLPTLDQARTTSRGIVMVDDTADAWGVELHQRGKTVWFEYNIDHSATNPRSDASADLVASALDDSHDWLDSDVLRSGTAVEIAAWSRRTWQVELVGFNEPEASRNVARGMNHMLTRHRQLTVRNGAVIAVGKVRGDQGIDVAASRDDRGQVCIESITVDPRLLGRLAESAGERLDASVAGAIGGILVEAGVGVVRERGFDYLYSHYLGTRPERGADDETGFEDWLRGQLGESVVKPRSRIRLGRHALSSRFDVQQAARASVADVEFNGWDNASDAARTLYRLLFAQLRGDPESLDLLDTPLPEVDRYARTQWGRGSDSPSELAAAFSAERGIPVAGADIPGSDGKKVRAFFRGLHTMWDVFPDVEIQSVGFRPMDPSIKATPDENVGEGTKEIFFNLRGDIPTDHQDKFRYGAHNVHPEAMYRFALVMAADAGSAVLDDVFPALLTRWLDGRDKGSYGNEDFGKWLGSQFTEFSRRAAFRDDHRSPDRHLYLDEKAALAESVVAVVRAEAPTDGQRVLYSLLMKHLAPKWSRALPANPSKSAVDRPGQPSAQTRDSTTTNSHPSDSAVDPICAVGAFADARDLGFDVQQPVNVTGPVPPAAVAWLAGAHHQRFDGGFTEMAEFLTRLGPGAGMLVNARPIGAAIGHLFLLRNDGKQLWIHDQHAQQPKRVFDPENPPFTAQTTHALVLTRRESGSTLESRQQQLGENNPHADPDIARGRALRPADAGALPPDNEALSRAPDGDSAAGRARAAIDKNALPKVKAAFDAALAAADEGDNTKLEQLQAALRRIRNEDQRTVLELRYLQHLTFAEIGDETGGYRSENATKHLHHRGVQALASILDEEAAPETKRLTPAEVLQVFAVTWTGEEPAPSGASGRNTVVSKLRQAILSGRLTEGRTLPPASDLAAQLGMSSASAVAAAYQQLGAEGYLVSRRKAGTRITSRDKWPVQASATPAADPIEAGVTNTGSLLYVVPGDVVTAEVVGNEHSSALNLRRCMDHALQALGHIGVSIPTGPNGEPQPPEMLVVATVQTAHFTGVALGEARTIRAIGLDAKRHVAVRTDLLLRMTQQEERSRMRELMHTLPAVHWDQAHISAKENVLALHSKLTGHQLRHNQVEVTFHPDTDDRMTGTFEAQLPDDAPAAGDAVYQGRYRIQHRTVVTAITLRNDGDAAGLYQQATAQNEESAVATERVTDSDDRQRSAGISRLVEPHADGDGFARGREQDDPATAAPVIPPETTEHPGLRTRRMGVGVELGRRLYQRQARASRPGTDPRGTFDPAVALDLPPRRARGLDGLGSGPPWAVANPFSGAPRGLPDGVVTHAADPGDPNGGAFGSGRSGAERIANAALSTFRVEATFAHLQNWAGRLSDDELHQLLVRFTHTATEQIAAFHRGKTPAVTDRVINPARLLGAIVAEATRRFGDNVPTTDPTTYRELFALGPWLKANRRTVADLYAAMIAVLDATFAVTRTSTEYCWSVDAPHHVVPAHLAEIAAPIEEAGQHSIWLEEDSFPPSAALAAEHARLVKSFLRNEVRDGTIARMVAEWAYTMDMLLQLRSGESFSPKYAAIFESLPIHALALDRARTGSDRLFAATIATALPALLDAAFYLLPTSNSALGLDYLRRVDDLLAEATTRFTNSGAIYALQDAADHIHRLYEEVIVADSHRLPEVRARRIHGALSDYFRDESESVITRSFLWGVRALWGLGSQSPGIEYAPEQHRLDADLPRDWDLTDDERALAATAVDLLRIVRGPEADIRSLLSHNDSPDLFESAFDNVGKNMQWWHGLTRWTDTVTIGSLLAGATDFFVWQMQLAVLRQYPHIIGAAAGIPYRARDLANRLSLARDLESPDIAPERRDELAALRDQLTEVRRSAPRFTIPGSSWPPVLLVSYDPVAEGGTGRAVVSIGEADSASFIAFNVTGADTPVTDLSHWSVHACQQYEKAQQHAPRDTRVAIMFTVGSPRGIDAPARSSRSPRGAGPDRRRRWAGWRRDPSRTAEPDTIDNAVAARDVAGDTVARELITYDATRELALDGSDHRWSHRSQLFTVIGHGDGIGVLRSAADTLQMSRAVDQIVLVPGSADDRLPTADQLHIGTEHVYTLNPHRDRNHDPNTIGLILVGQGADIESAPDASSRSAAPLIETPTTVRDVSQLLTAHEYRPLGGRRGFAMTHDEGLTVYRAAQPLLHDALSGTYNTTVILKDLGLVLRIGRPDTGSYDPRFGPEHSTLPDISQYVRNAPQLLKVITGRMPDGRVVDESTPILIERLARGDNLAETFRRADRRTIRTHQGLILRAFANIHEQLRAMPEDHPLLHQLTPPGVDRGDTGGWYLNHIDWYTENFYRRHYDRFGPLFDEFGLLRGNPFEPLIDEARSMRESRHHILHADPNEGNFLISNELHVTLLDWELAVTGPSAYDWARLGHLIPGIEVPRILGGPDMVKFARLEKFKRVMNDTVKLAPLAAAGQLTPQLIEFINSEFSEAVIQVRELSGHTKLLPPRAELDILRSWQP
ncbi:LuxR C-terminal-related transcriptional regulator [Nocardia arthritidis]|uniref:LuxR C-terminal-related transcriptional regulator n=1 Tax=Nocardia arthritidis TaxID=228602 RepID=UPI0012ECBB07